MTDECCRDGCAGSTAVSNRFRKILWLALLINVIMFSVELWGGLGAGSVSLMADAMDFLGDAANYAISLSVLSLGLLWRARTALLKGIVMGGFGLFVLGGALWSFLAGIVPEPHTMGIIGIIALLANVLVATLLYAFREGEANMRSVWLCSRNDAIGNLAVIFAAIGVFGTGSAWPDLLVACLMASLGLSAAVHIIKTARAEIHATR